MGIIMSLLPPSPCIIIMTIIIMGSISGLAGCWGKGPLGIGPPYIGFGLPPKFPKFGPQLFGPAPGLLGLFPQLLLGPPPALPPELGPGPPAPEEGPVPALGPP